MRLPGSVKNAPRIEIIPMIDTMFFLLVFFMIATLSMTIQHGMPVTLPPADSSTDKVKEHISLTISEDERLFYNKEAINLAELETRLMKLLQGKSEPSIVINADKHVSHGRVVQIMDTIRLSGIQNMAIATQPEINPL